MLCQQITNRLDDFVDDECDPDERKAIQEHLNTCPDCRRQVETLERFNRSIADTLGSARAPDGLWRRIHGRLPAPEAETSMPRIRRVAPLSAWPMAIAASLMLLIALPVGLGWWPARTDNAIIQEPVQDFAAYRDSGRSLDIASPEPAVIYDWFDSRLPFELPAIKTNVAGFELAGGRLCWFLDRRLGALAYQRGDETLSVYIMSDYDLTLPAMAFEPSANLHLSSHQLENLRTMIWHDNGLVYVVVSDLSQHDMSAFLAAFAQSQVDASKALAPGIAASRSVEPTGSTARPERSPS